MAAVIKVMTVTDQQLDAEILEGYAFPIVVLVIARDHAPSNKLDRLLCYIGGEWEKDLIYLRLWADENPTWVKSRGLERIPAVLAFHNGQPHGGRTGALSAKELTQFLVETVKLKTP